jgi:hypothetical protein
MNTVQIHIQCKCGAFGFVTDALLMFEADWSYTLTMSYIQSQLFEMFMMFVMFVLADYADGIDVVVFLL